MLAIISPAKDMKVVPLYVEKELTATKPVFVDQAAIIMRELKKMDQDTLAHKMKMSSKLAELNRYRYLNWTKKHEQGNSLQAVLAFTGEAYRGLSAETISVSNLEYSQSVLRILSGLYGVLRPLDLIREYRLEMGTSMQVKNNGNLYEFWRNKVSTAIEEAVNASPGEIVLINLASKEYASVIDFKKLKCKVITPNFYNEEAGNLKTVSVYAKRARGLMTRFIIQNHLERAEDLKAFVEEGYYYDSKRSDENNWTFVR